jgi:hypothetical protein
MAPQPCQGAGSAAATGDEDYHVVKKEADVAREDVAPPQGSDVPQGAGDLPPEYQELMAGVYDEEALLQQVLEASKADVDEAYPGYSNAISLMGMVADHLASLPPHYERQEVPPPPSIPRRHRDHPHGVVINPPPQP